MCNSCAADGLEMSYTFKVVGYSRLGKSEARKAWKKNYDKKIVSMGTSRKPCEQTQIRSNLNMACERTELERHTIHNLRHDGISRLVILGY